MQMLRLGQTELRASRIAFGTAAIHHVRTTTARQRLLLAAADIGITHFDTSPYYGFGIAERTLAALASASQKTTVATKVGLYPPGGADAAALTVLCRKVGGRFVSQLSRPLVDFQVTRARASLSESLRRMRRERVDVLFLHEPRYDLLETDEWLRWLEAEKDRVGAIGVAGEAERVAPFIRVRSPFAAVVQTRDSLSRHQAEPLRAAGREPDITYGHLAQPRNTGDIAETLRRTIARWPATVLLISTRRAERIRELQHIALASEARIQVGATA